MPSDLVVCPAVLSTALHELRQRLQDLGSNLVVRTGSVSTILPALCQSVSASTVVTEMEVETR